MIKHEFFEDDDILIIEAGTSLNTSDFNMLSTLVDPYIHEHGKLNGLISKVAAMADEGIIAVMPVIADRFVKADVRHFDFDDLAGAIEWIKQN